MAFTFHKLELYQDLRFSKTEGPHVMKSETLSTAVCKVTARDMEPVFEDYLTNETWCGYGFIPGDESPDLPVPDACIPAGTYLFMRMTGLKMKKTCCLKHQKPSLWRASGRKNSLRKLSIFVKYRRAAGLFSSFSGVFFSIS